MKGSKYPDDIRSKAKELIYSGMTKHATAVQLGIPLGTITSWNIPSKNQRFYSSEIKERAKVLALEGKSRYKISAELGIPYGTLAKWLYGISTYHKLPESIKQRAIEMLSSGFSRTETAGRLGISITTLNKWSIPIPNKQIIYTDEFRKKALDLVTLGKSRLKTAAELGINLKTLNKWLNRAPEIKRYPDKFKKKVRHLIKSGVQKTELSNMLKVSYPTIVRWTSDIKTKNSRIGGAYFGIICRLVNYGFVIITRRELSMYRFLNKYADIKSVVFGKKVVLFVSGKEVRAKAALIKALNPKILSKRNINTLNLSFKFSKDKSENSSMARIKNL